jgi:flagellar basal body-associated protein FliL
MVEVQENLIFILQRKMKQSTANIAIAVLVLLIAIAAIVTGWMMASSKKPVPKDLPPAPAYLNLDKEISTAINGSNRGSVIVKVSVEIKDQETLKVAKAWEPMIAAEISGYLNRKTFEELAGPENMGAVSEGIKSHLNQSLGDTGLKDVVKSVQFSKYITQY